MSERDQVIASTLIQHMSESQKQQLFDVINKYDEIRAKLAPIMIAGEEVLMLPSIKINLGFSGHLVLGN